MADDQDEQQTERAAKEQLQRRRLARLIEALPIFSGVLSADGHLTNSQPQSVDGFLWQLPSFSYDRNSATQIMELCQRAAAGERIQVERPYRRDWQGESERFGRGLLTLTPIQDEDGHIEELTVTLIDCDDNGLELPDGDVRNRLSEINKRIENMLGLAQTVIEMSMGDAPQRQTTPVLRDQLSQRLNMLADVIDVISDPDQTHWPLSDLVNMLKAQRPGAQAPQRLQHDIIDGNVAIAHVPVLTLLLFELASNAQQYGAWQTQPGGAAGTVSIQSDLVDRRDGRRLRIHWIEDGGPLVQTELGRGFGFTLAEGLFAQITGGTAERINTADGLSWVFELPTERDDTAVPSDFGYDGYAR